MATKSSLPRVTTIITEYAKDGNITDDNNEYAVDNNGFGKPLAKGNNDSDVANNDNKPLSNNVNDKYTKGNDNNKYIKGKDNNKYAKGNNDGKHAEGNKNNDYAKGEDDDNSKYAKEGDLAKGDGNNEPLTKGKGNDKYDKGDNKVNEVYIAPLFAHVDVIMAEIRAMDSGLGEWTAFAESPHHHLKNHHASGALDDVFLVFWTCFFLLSS